VYQVHYHFLVVPVTCFDPTFSAAVAPGPGRCTDARTIQLAYRRHLRQKYAMTMKECVEATMERRLGKLITRKRFEGNAGNSGRGAGECIRGQPERRMGPGR